VAPGWGWLPPPSPAAVQLLCCLCLAAAAAVACGLACRAASLALLPLCCYLAAIDQDPGSQATSLMLQLGVANCLMPLCRWPGEGVETASESGCRALGRRICCMAAGGTLW
jgi:hypothetical protein